MDLKPGQTITCTVQSEPTSQSKRLTIQRLMRRDPETIRALRRGQRLRQVNAQFHQRGGRPWQVRERCGKVVHPRVGNSWTMTYTPDLEPDIESVRKHLSIETTD